MVGQMVSQMISGVRFSIQCAAFLAISRKLMPLP
jgi:hypothetical protein